MDKQMVQKILGAMDDDRIVEFERSIVQIPSFTTQESRLARFIADYMRGIGGDLEVELQEVQLADGEVSHNAVARLPGTGGGKSLLLYGHIDHGPLPHVVKHDAERLLKGWVHEPFAAVVEDGWLYGKGCQDEKGGVTGLVMAAEALVKSGVKLRGDVIFAGVQGHKRVSSGTLHLLKNAGVRTDYAINTENSGNSIVPSFVGRSEGKIHIRAPELHFHTKDSWPEELRNQLTAFELLNQIHAALGPEMQPPGPDTWMTFEPHPDLPGYPQIRTEVVEFHGLSYLVLEFQVRIVAGMTDETITQDLKRLLSKFEEKYPYLKTEVEWPSQTDTRPAVTTPNDHAIVQSLARWHEHVTGEPTDIGFLGRSGAAADGSHTFGAGIPTVIYGPGGGETDKEYRYKARTKQGPPDERVAIKDLLTTAKVLALTAADLCG